MKPLDRPDKDLRRQVVGDLWISGGIEAISIDGHGITLVQGRKVGGTLERARHKHIIAEVVSGMTIQRRFHSP